MKTVSDDIRYRLHAMGLSLRGVARRQHKIISADAKGLIGTARWMFQPEKYSIAHMDVHSREKNPYGSRWVTLVNGVDICSQCRTGKPSAFVEFALNYQRWDPGSARQEIMHLIERGELSDSQESRERWRVIPPGSMLIYTSGLETGAPILTAIDSEGEYFSMSTLHLIDMPESELADLIAYFEEVIPEWRVSRNEVAVSTVYDGRLDVMSGMTPMEFQFAESTPIPYDEEKS